jgi:Ser/Thr protein kinase RdoA (MazF antagonist)
MEKTVQVLFENGILENSLKFFHLDERVEKLGDFENYVFKVFKNESPFALRITHSSHRCYEEIAAELDWINYLHANHVDCPKAFPSVNGKLIEIQVAEDGSQFFACLFSFVPGFPVKMNSDKFNHNLFYAWGKATGRMHAVTKNYQPHEGIKPRPSWYEEELLDIEKYVEDTDVIENTRLLIEEIKLLPQNLDNFGLIHTDIHSGNFFYDGETIHVFDFDDSSYHWFASDIAIPLYYSIYYGYQNASKLEKEVFAQHFLENFLKGYETENSIPEKLMEHIPLFFKLRDITLYSVLHKKIAPEDRDERLNHLLEVMKQRIIHKELIVEI